MVSNRKVLANGVLGRCSPAEGQTTVAVICSKR